MIELTPAGHKAAQILHWAYGDPAGRARQAMDQIGQLAVGVTDPKAQNEIADAGTQVSRLAGSLQARSISDQMAGG